MPTQPNHNLYHHLLAKGALGLHDLTAAFNSDPVTMRRQLAELEAEDLIEQAPAVYTPTQASVRKWQVIDAK